jgi:hypothetical protein
MAIMKWILVYLVVALPIAISLGRRLRKMQRFYPPAYSPGKEK